MENDRVLAHMLVNYSVSLKKGEKVFVEVTDVPDEFVMDLIEEIAKVGGYPILFRNSSLVSACLLKNTDEQYAKLKYKYYMPIMKDMDAYIGVRGINNLYELSDVNATHLKIDDLFYKEPITNQRVNNTKWVILNYPTPSLAQNANLSTPVFKDYFYQVCNFDYQSMDEYLKPLEALMDKTDKVHICGNGTDLTFSIKGIKAVRCAGKCNIPDGEVYTAPIKESVNGYVRYTIPTIYQGKRFDDVVLTVKSGKIVDAKSSNTAALNYILDTDQGARYFGEFALGVNPKIRKPMLDILFDEKMYGSFHLTPGCCYEDASNGNKSAIHWDMVCCQTKEYGGGEIWFDDVLVRKDGVFVLPELQNLNFLSE